MPSAVGRAEGTTLHVEGSSVEGTPVWRMPVVCTYMVPSVVDVGAAAMTVAFALAEPLTAAVALLRRCAAESPSGIAVI
jgi:hypothetical protein